MASRHVECCDRQLLLAVVADRNLSSGFAQHGQLWECPGCGMTWRHICEESSGCHWEQVATEAKRA